MSACRASLGNLGEGTLEFTNSTLTFYVDVGVFRKKKKVVREIAITDILSIKDSVTELAVVWKDDTVNTDAFAISTEQRTSARRLYTAIDEALEKSRELEDKEKTENELRKRAEKRREDLNEALKISIDTINALFDILRSLHGDVKWDLIETHLDGCEENAERLQTKMNTLDMDFTTLSSAVKEHMVKVIARETCNILVFLHEYFSKLTLMGDDGLPQFHPNYRDVNAIISANYVLNDIMLGVLVEDKEVREEINEFMRILEKLTEETGLAINIGAIEDVVNKLVTEKANIIEEVREVFGRELREFNLPETTEHGFTSEETTKQEENGQHTPH